MRFEVASREDVRSIICLAELYDVMTRVLVAKPHEKGAGGWMIDS